MNQKGGVKPSIRLAGSNMAFFNLRNRELMVEDGVCKTKDLVKR